MNIGPSGWWKASISGVPGGSDDFVSDYRFFSEEGLQINAEEVL